MSVEKNTDPIEACETVLREEKEYNTEHNILPQQVVLVGKLLERRAELRDAYNELYVKLASREFGLMAFFRVLLTTADLWNPERLAEGREDRKALRDTNKKIAETAFALASLMEERDRLNNQSEFHIDTHHHIIDVIEEASEHNCLFESWVKEKLSALAGQFDLKYWPSLSKVVAVIGENANRAEINPYHPPAAVGTASSRPSKADFVKALLATIDEHIGEHQGDLPEGFVLTDNSLASLANCVLDLGPDSLMDGPYVKHLRQRERSRVQPPSVYPARRERLG